MKLNRILSALTAVVTAIPCMYFPSVSAISSQSTSTTASETEKEPVHIPDFPEEILKEFNISKFKKAVYSAINDLISDHRLCIIMA